MMVVAEDGKAVHVHAKKDSLSGAENVKVYSRKKTE